jgi:hypothetical protein
MIISLSVLLKMRNVSDKSCRGNQKTFYVGKLSPEIRAFYEIMRKYVIQSDRPQMTI